MVDVDIWGSVLIERQRRKPSRSSVSNIKKKYCHVWSRQSGKYTGLCLVLIFISKYQPLNSKIHLLTEVSHWLIKYISSYGLRSWFKAEECAQFEMFGVRATFKSSDQLSLITEWMVILFLDNVKVKLKFVFKLEGNTY